MKQRGRKSTALTVASAGANMTHRPAPPASCTQLQRSYWLEITNRLPAEWFTDDNKHLLAQYCRTLSTLDVLNALIDEQEAAKEIKMGQYLELVRQRDAMARLQLTQATKMRLTQQSRYKAEKAATHHARAGNKPQKKLWES